VTHFFHLVRQFFNSPEKNSGEHCLIHTITTAITDSPSSITTTSGFRSSSEGKTCESQMVPDQDCKLGVAKTDHSFEAIAAVVLQIIRPLR